MRDYHLLIYIFFYNYVKRIHESVMIKVPILFLLDFRFRSREFWTGSLFKVLSYQIGALLISGSNEIKYLRVSNFFIN